MAALSTWTPAMSAAPRQRWTPAGAASTTEILVAQGDLTTSCVDAIVNPANSWLLHGGGLARAIVVAGGDEIDRECQRWRRRHGQLPVGHAITTGAGRLPCRYVIHAVGPNIRHGQQNPTRRDAQHLRTAVWQALCEASKLQLSSIAIPGISTGIFGYPRHLAAREIVNECQRFCCEQRDSGISTILLMDIDDTTVEFFERVILQAKGPKEEPIIRTDAASAHTTITEDIIARFDVMNDDTDDGQHEDDEMTGARPVNYDAGLLLFRHAGSEVEVLVQVERTRTKTGTRRLALVEARVHRGEDTMATVCQMLEDATRGQVDIHEWMVEREITGMMQPLWLDFASYLLFAVPIVENYSWCDNIPRLVLKPNRGDTKCELNRGDEPSQYSNQQQPSTKQVAWVKWSDLAGKCATNRDYHASSFLHLILQKSRTQVETTFAEMNYRARATGVLHRLACYQELDDEQLVCAFLGDKWQLNVRSLASSMLSKPVPPKRRPKTEKPEPAPEAKVFHHRTISSPLRKIMNDLPKNIEYTWRCVTPSPGILKSFQDVSRARRKKVTIKKPLFHGTPEHWRAEAIATTGFDVGIIIHGRALGDGVYTAATTTLPLRYAGSTGSLVVMKGIVSTGSRIPKPIVRDDVYVFPDARALLPMYVIDFWKRSDPSAHFSPSVPRWRKTTPTRTLPRRYHLSTHMRHKESRFVQATAANLRSAMLAYCGAVDPFSVARAIDRASHALPLKHCLEDDKNRFLSFLAQYATKKQLQPALRQHLILIFTRNYGSTANTHVHHALLDDLVASRQYPTYSPNKPCRRIIVLLSRRSTVISLAQRIAQERGSQSSREVAYSLGRGESNVKEGMTLLEFMTYGRFISIAKNTKRFLAKYCVVVVDNMDERSVDIDISLALLKRAVAMHKNQQPTQHGPSESRFQVVCCSMASTEEVAQYQNYLDPDASVNKEKSTIIELSKQIPFPIHVEHRRDISINPSVITTNEVTEFVSKYAIPTAIDLMNATDEGNIVIFLPGMGSITAALRATQNVVIGSKWASLSSAHPNRSHVNGGFTFRMRRPLDASQVQPTKDTRPIDNATAVVVDSNDSEQKAASGTAIARPEYTVVSAIAFEGKMTRSQRDRIAQCHIQKQHSSDSGHRLIIFLSNMTETDSTELNVRYVIDTGLERRVRWNEKLGMDEITTTQVTSQTMQQRMRCAGTVGSGICIRLFPDVCDTTGRSSVCSPGVEHAAIHKLVLVDKWLQRRGRSLGGELEMISPIGPVARARAALKLQALGVLDTHHQMTDHGDVIFSLGVDLRLGRFLLVCNALGCLGTGVKLASVLALAAPERLLPTYFSSLNQSRYSAASGFEFRSRKEQQEQEHQRVLVHPSGDHLTLLNIVEAFDHAQMSNTEVPWCRSLGLEIDLLREAARTRQHLSLVLARRGFAVVDDSFHDGGDVRGTQAQTGSTASVHSLLLEALACSYVDHLVMTHQGDRLENGLKRLQPESVEDSKQAVKLTDDDVDPNRDTIAHDIGLDALTLQLSPSSTLWSVTRNNRADFHHTPGTRNVVVFSSGLLTDASNGVLHPVVTLASVVGRLSVDMDLPDWCRPSAFDALLSDAQLERIRVPLTANDHHVGTVDGRWMTSLRSQFASTTVAIKKSKRKKTRVVRGDWQLCQRRARHVLVLTAPRRLLPRIREHIQQVLLLNLGRADTAVPSL